MSYATTGSPISDHVPGPVDGGGPRAERVHTNRLGGIPLSRLGCVPPSGLRRTSRWRRSAIRTRMATCWCRSRQRSHARDLLGRAARPLGWDRAIPSSRGFRARDPRRQRPTFLLNSTAQPPWTTRRPAIITPDGSIGVCFAREPARTSTVRVWELGPGRARNPHRSLIVDPPGDDVPGASIIRNDRPTRVSLAGWRSRRQQPPGECAMDLPVPRRHARTRRGCHGLDQAGDDDEHNLYWGRTHSVWNNVGGDAAILATTKATSSPRSPGDGVWSDESTAEKPIPRHVDLVMQLGIEI